MRLRIPSAWFSNQTLKFRLYSVFVFLGLLPVVGVMLAFVAFQTANREDAALDRVTRGTIHLERINGLVYAVVMESRGIYMSSDWQTAEPFASKLTQYLADLQVTAKAWKTDAIVAQRNNVGELSKRIDQFVLFRSEL